MDLDPTLARDTVEVTRLPLCRVLLMKDRRFPWLVLVPERSGVREICELAPADRAALVEEIAQASEVLRLLFRPDKLNVGALGTSSPSSTSTSSPAPLRTRPGPDRSGAPGLPSPTRKTCSPTSAGTLPMRSGHRERRAGARLS